MRRWDPGLVAVALLAWTALITPLSVGIGEYFAYYDPQSDPERLAYHRDLAAHVYTAGHWAGQLAAALTGAWLAARPGKRRRGTMTSAALFGGALGLGVGVVAIAGGVRAVRSNGYPSVAPDPTMLTDPAVLRCVVVSLVCFPLWALLGAAIAGLVRRGAPVAVVAAFLAQPATLLLWVGVVAPPSSHPLAVATIIDGGREALLMPAVLLVWTAAATTAATLVRRRGGAGPAGSA